MRKPFRILLAGLAAWAALAAPAAADDIDLLQKTAPAPNVMVILDTSQSMTWYAPDGPVPWGFTRGDEYQGWAGDGTPKARLAAAKSVMRVVVDAYASELTLGLATYPLANSSPATPNENVEIVWYNYYYNDPSRKYAQFDWNQLANVIQAPLDATNIYMPKLPSFTVKWKRNGDGPASWDVPPVPPVPPFDYCGWQVDRYVPPNTLISTSYPAYGTPGSCVPAGQTRRVDHNVTFNEKVSGDDPKPYKYNHAESWAIGPPIEGVSLISETNAHAYNTQFANFLEFYDVYTSLGQLTNPGSPGLPGYTLYNWTYYYRADCVAGCAGTSVFTASYSTPWLGSPPTQASPGDPYGPPYAPDTELYTDTYNWSGNNYRISSAISPEPSCTVAPNGWSKLVDVGPTPPNGALIKNYLGTGIGMPGPKEIHGADASTPLKYVLNSAQAYFLKETGPVQTDPKKNCRGNYVILVTDGGESCPLVPIENSPEQNLAGGAGEAAAQLLAAPVNNRPGKPTGVITYVVGLDQGGLGPDEQNVLGAIARRGAPAGQSACPPPGGPYYCPANDEASLKKALDDIIGSILAQEYAGFSAPAVPVLRRTDNLVLTEGSFNTPGPDLETPWWRGELTGFKLTDDGKIDSTLFKAGDLLAAQPWASRVIWAKPTGASGLVKFKDGDFDPYLSELLGAGDPATLRDIVRGNNGKPFKLGDIFHSNPALVGPPNPAYVDRTFDPTKPATDPPVLLSLADAPDTFGPYRNLTSPINVKTRKRLILVGANDGMLHAFNGGEFDPGTGKYTKMDNAGKEEWAFIPTQMLGKLHFLGETNGHKYYVDGSPKAADVWLDGVPNDGPPTSEDGIKASNEWHAVVVGGFRQGGTDLYALDVTDTQNPKFMWKYPTTGESWSEPVFAKVRAQVAGKGVDRFVVVVGDGYSADGTTGKKLHVIDIKTGKPLWQYATTGPVAATPLVVDVNGDGYADRVYVGTVDGKMLRCDISAVAQNSANGNNVDPDNGFMENKNWSCTVMLNAGPNQPFYTSAAIMRVEGGQFWIFFGSGDRSDPILIPATQYRFYAMKDPGTTTLTEANLADVTSKNTLTPGDLGVNGPNGWFIKFGTDGEKTFGDAPLAFNRQVVFSTFRPVTGACDEIGKSYVYTVYYRTGGGVTDTLQYGIPIEQRTVSSRTTEYNGVVAKPVVTLGLHGSKGVVYAGTKELKVEPAGSIRATVYWKIVP